MSKKVQICLIDLDGHSHHWEVRRGTNLRRAMLDHGYSPYTKFTEEVNCGGKGICATCGVWLEINEPDPLHWHDKAAKRFGYPRLSCQIRAEEDLTIRLVKKRVWGRRNR